MPVRVVGEGQDSSSLVVQNLRLFRADRFAWKTNSANQGPHLHLEPQDLMFPQYLKAPCLLTQQAEEDLNR